MDEIIKREDALFGHVSKLIDEAHKHVKTTVNATMVYTYYGVGKYIVGIIAFHEVVKMMAL